MVALSFIGITTFKTLGSGVCLGQFSLLNFIDFHHVTTFLLLFVH